MGSANFTNLYPETPLLRNASSLFSLTFDEVQNVLGDPGANPGSMNIDELLRNIWTAEESQAMASAMNPVEGLNRGLSSQFSLQNQGSLCLLRTLSTKPFEDWWKNILPQQGSTEAAPVGINHHRQMSLEDFLVKAGVGKERPLHGEVTLEDFLVKTGIVKEGTPVNLATSNQAPVASGNTAPLNQVQQVPASHTVMASNQAHQGPLKPFAVPANQLHKGSTIPTLTPTNQVQQVPPIPAHAHATPMQSHSVHEQAPPNQAFMGFAGFPIPRNNGGLESKNGQADPSTANKAGQADPSVVNSFVPTAANVLPCPPTQGKTRLNVHNNMFVPGQQSEWMNAPYGKSITHQNQLVHRQAVAEATSALGNMSNASNGPPLESSPGRMSPLGGGLGAVLGTGGLGMSHGGNAYPSRISFGPCSPLSPEFDEGSPETSTLLFAEFGNGRPQRKKRCINPPVERVIERRQRRMIKNRESAARSRARKQAYTVELEAEVSQLKEENMELLRKQEEEAALRKKQILALMPSTPEIGHKGRSLKRTHTGPW